MERAERRHSYLDCCSAELVDLLIHVVTVAESSGTGLSGKKSKRQPPSGTCVRVVQREPMSGKVPTPAEPEVHQLRAGLAAAEASAQVEARGREHAPVSRAETAQMLSAVSGADARELAVRRQGVLRAVAEAEADDMECAVGRMGITSLPSRSNFSRGEASQGLGATAREKIELTAMILFVCGIIAGGSYYIAHIFFGVKQEQPTKPGEEDHDVAAGKRMEQYVKFGFTLFFMLLMMSFFWCVCRDSCKRKWGRVVRSRFRPSPEDELAHARMIHHESEMAAARALSQENSV